MIHLPTLIKNVFYCLKNPGPSPEEIQLLRQSTLQGTDICGDIDWDSIDDLGEDDLDEQDSTKEPILHSTGHKLHSKQNLTKVPNL